MILHYLKIVFRGMRNYKTQSVINITGLAIGFTAFALAGYWYLNLCYMIRFLADKNGGKISDVCSVYKEV